MTPSLKPISQQVIVITGASSGIGLATARAAAERGAKLVLGARSQETLEGIAEELRRRNAEVVSVRTDVRLRSDLEQLANRCLIEFGRIDTWVNNAGVSIYGRLDEVTEEDSRRLFDVNFWGVVNGSLVALPHLKRSRGALINVGSEVSDAVVPLQGMYSASKHAVKGFTDALRVEVGEVDEAPVSITLVQPTAVNTPYPQHARNYMKKEPKLPTPQIDPERVAEAILRAASKRTRHVRVGVFAKLNSAAARLAPRLSDKISAKQANRQQYDEQPRDPDGTLEKPGESGRTHGSGPRRGELDALTH
jgi:short-subunit dehydrogenase